MNINKTITLGWKGEEYSLIVTMRSIDHIEANGINLLSMVRDCSSGDLKMGQSAKLIALLLQIAGAKELSSSLDAAQEEVWAAMCAKGEVSISEVILTVSEILSVIFFRSKKKSTPKRKKRAKK